MVDITPIKFTAVPKYLKFNIEIPAPTEEDEDATTIKSFKFYVHGPGCPVPIVIDVDQIEADYEEKYPSDEDRNNLSITQYIARAKRANLIKFRDTLVAISRPQLPMEVANSLANDEINTGGLKILELTEWRKAPVVDPNAETESEEPTEGEAKEVDVTGD